MGSITIGFIKIDFSIIISFGIGAAIGALLFFLVYLILVIASNDKRLKRHETKIEFTQDELNEMIADYQNRYTDSEMKSEKGRISHCANLCKDLAIDIAAKFYPESKYPLMELTVDESILLIGYLDERLNKIANQKIARMIVKRLKISKLVTMGQKKKDKERALKKTDKQSTMNKIGEAFKSLVEKTRIIDGITNKLFKSIIAIVGNEFYGIYSKKKLNVEISYDVEAIINEVNESDDKQIDYQFKTHYLRNNKPFEALDIYNPNMPLKVKGGGKLC